GTDLGEHTPVRSAGIRLMTGSSLNADVARPIVGDSIIRSVRGRVVPSTLPDQAYGTRGTRGSGWADHAHRPGRSGGSSRADWARRALGPSRSGCSRRADDQAVARRRDRHISAALQGDVVLQRIEAFYNCAGRDLVRGDCPGGQILVRYRIRAEGVGP